VIVNTMVRHELSGGEYAQRRRECEDAVAYFRRANPEVRALRDVHIEQVESSREKLAEMTWKRARHVVSEIARTTAAAALLARRHYEDVGELMRQSHASLRDD